MVGLVCKEPVVVGLVCRRAGCGRVGLQKNQLQQNVPFEEFMDLVLILLARQVRVIVGDSGLVVVSVGLCKRAGHLRYGAP